MKIISAQKKHLKDILEIFNEAITTTTSVYYYNEWSLSEIENWFEEKKSKTEPILIAINDKESIMGFASYGEFRKWPGFKFTQEHSLYVSSDHVRKGVGKLLLGAIIDKARDNHCKTLVAGIDSSNEASIKLHELYGFSMAGELKSVGYKFDHWLNLKFYQLML